MRYMYHALLVLVLCVSATAQEFHVVASRSAVVREQPDRQAVAVTQLDRGDQVACFTDPETQQAEQRNRFYHIHLVDGRNGWVSRYRVRIAPGPPPRPIPTPTESPIEAASRAFHLAIGPPLGYVELVNEGYVVGYDPRLKIPAWVQYRLTRQHLATDRTRSNDFRIDDRVKSPGRSTLNDYETAASWELWERLRLQPPPPESSNSPNYARGHMAPARDLTRTDEIERSTYLLSNMAPQVHNGYNNGTWSSLERRVRGWVESRGDLTIIAGPVFFSSERLRTPAVQEAERLQGLNETVVSAQPPTERQVLYNVVGDGEVAVPTAFFKVVVDPSNRDNPDVLAFLIPHYRKTGRRLENLLVSVDDIERLTGLELLSAFPEDVQNRVEEYAADRLW